MKVLLAKAYLASLLLGFVAVIGYPVVHSLGWRTLGLIVVVLGCVILLLLGIGWAIGVLSDEDALIASERGKEMEFGHAKNNAERTRYRFFWMPTLVGHTTYWLERRLVRERYHRCVYCEGWDVVEVLA